MKSLLGAAGPSLALPAATSMPGEDRPEPEEDGVLVHQPAAAAFSAVPGLIFANLFVIQLNILNQLIRKVGMFEEYCIHRSFSNKFQFS